MTRLWTVLAGTVLALAVLAPAAAAKERTLTLYSPKIDSLPYVHDTHNVTLRSNGREAPAKPGYILGFKEMALVDSKDPKAKPLPIAKMMVHHFLYYAPGRVNDVAGELLARVGLHRRPRRGAPARADDEGDSEAVPRQLRHREPDRGRIGAGLAPDRDGDEPLQAAQELLRPHQDPLHDRAADRRRAAGDRRLQPPAERHVVRRRRRRRRPAPSS